MHRPRFLLFVFFAMTSSLMAQSLFAPVVTHYSGGQVASSVIVVDVNGDGKPDLVVSNECENSNTCGNGTVGVLLGNGDGTFQKAATFQSGGYGSVTVAATDVNSDGLPDLLVASVCASSSNCPSGIITLLLGNGDGTFQNAALVATYGSGQNATFSMTVADVNGDGKPDLLVSNQCESGSNCAGKVGVLLGNGDGSFQGAVTYDSGGSGALGVAVGDVNGDGKPDLLVANICPSGGESCNANGSVGVLLGNGDGTFQQPLSFGSDRKSVV